MSHPLVPTPPTHVPVAVGDITLVLLDRPVRRDARRRMLLYHVQLDYADGQHHVLCGRLDRLLDGEELAELLSVLDAVRATAERKMLPHPPRRAAQAHAVRREGDHEPTR